MRKGSTGGSLGGMEVSPAAKRRYAKRMRAEERSWRARNGPVTTRKITPPLPNSQETPREADPTMRTESISPDEQ